MDLAEASFRVESMPPSESPQAKPHPPQHLREMLFLAEQSREGTIKVLPGDAWSLHYPAEGSIRTQKLLQLLQGKGEPEDIANDLKPDALLYDAGDIARQGLEKVSAKIRDLSATITHYDYERLARFVHAMQGKDIDLPTVQALYDGIAQSRIKQRLLDAYGPTGKRQLETALRAEAATLAKNMRAMSGLERVLAALKLEWLHKKGLAGSDISREIDQQITRLEQALLQKMASDYSAYAEHGAEDAYQHLVQSVQESLPDIAELKNQSSPAMERLQHELEQYRQHIPPPPPPEGPAFPPDAADLHNEVQHLEGGESVEGIPNKPMYEIAPSGVSKNAMTGKYLEMQKSYFLRAEKTWSNRTVLGPEYKENVAGTARQTISGTINPGLKSLGLPRTYALDMGSLHYSGATPHFYKDQNGCFYVTADDLSTFSIDFLKEKEPFLRQPIEEDILPLTSAVLSAETEKFMQTLGGTPAAKAGHIRAYIHRHHWYPGGGDREAARALKLKVKTESTPENYLQTIDRSEYLDCDLSGTLGVHLLRRAGIPATLGVGHAVDHVRNGKAVMDASTGHAWAEFWDGSGWVPIDFTPKSKPQDKKKDGKENNGENETGQPANDGSLETPPGSGEQGDIADQARKKVEEQLASLQQQNMGTADARDVAESEKALEAAQQALERMGENQQELKQQLERAQTFKDMENVRKETQQAELLDDMKEELERNIDAKEEQMKEGIREELDTMEEDGFIDENRKRELQENLERMEKKNLDALKKEVEKEQGLFNEYEVLREQVEPLVERWFRYFAERLPRQSEMEADEDAIARQGAWDRRAAMKYRNLLFGTLRNPRVIRSSVKPRFLASIMLDVSGSMAGEKLRNATTLLVFYCELFTRISHEFGYIRFAINIFSDSVTEIKAYDQDYDSSRRYTFADGQSATIKARLMTAMREQGGTNMLDALRKAATDLQQEKLGYPGYVSAFYFLGDGGDTCGNKANIQQLLAEGNEDNGFGGHMRSAILLGKESERKVLAELFGDEHTTVAPDFETLVEQSMFTYADDIEGYMEHFTIVE